MNNCPRLAPEANSLTERFIEKNFRQKRSKLEKKTVNSLLPVASPSLSVVELMRLAGKEKAHYCDKAEIAACGGKGTEILGIDQESKPDPSLLEDKIKSIAELMDNHREKQRRLRDSLQNRRGPCIGNVYD